MNSPQPINKLQIKASTSLQISLEELEKQANDLMEAACELADVLSVVSEPISDDEENIKPTCPGQPLPPVHTSIRSISNRLDDVRTKLHNTKCCLRL